MNLEKALDKMKFDIDEGEDDIVSRLVESYKNASSEADFIYTNRHYLDKIDEQRVKEFIEIVGRSKQLTLRELHEAFDY